MLPFSHEQFLAVFAAYNTAIWPAQIGAYAIGTVICFLMLFAARKRDAWIAAALAVLWIWTGAAYHLTFFTRINALAPLFGVGFIAQGLLFLFAGMRGSVQWSGGQDRRLRTASGWMLIAYSAVVYPAIGFMSGMHYPEVPVFGVSPCPLTLFTWGLLLMTRKVPWWLLAIPFAWSLVGGSAAFLLHVPQDWPLLASAVVAFVKHQ